jgi:hypothetical protein
MKPIPLILATVLISAPAAASAFKGQCTTNSKDGVVYVRMLPSPSNEWDFDQLENGVKVNVLGRYKSGKTEWFWIDNADGKDHPNIIKGWVRRSSLSCEKPDYWGFPDEVIE